MSDTILKVENLSKIYNAKSSMFGGKSSCVYAVNNISFEIKKGQTLALVGESGCGKSTTGKVILNLTTPTSGKVVFNDNVLFDINKNYKISKNKMQQMRQKMQIIFQDPYACLDPRMTILEIVSEGIKKHTSMTKKQRREKVIDLLLQCGLDENSLLKFPHQFSGGQRQRIGIARALSLEPSFIVCDEPTAALDVSIQSQILNLMHKLRKDYHLTYLFISHNLSIVEHFSDQVCVMYLGKIVEQADTKQLFKTPKHPYTKALLASAPKFGEDRSFLSESSALQGEIPSPNALPKGCLFHTRCPMVQSTCLNQQPILKNTSKSHRVACHFIEG